MSAAPLIWGLFTPHCYSVYFTSFDFFHAECFKLLLSKVLGYAIITGAIVVKLPQILKFLKSARTDGVSPFMYWFENIGYTISAAYSLRSGFPFSTWGENLFLLVQGLAIITIIAKLNQGFTSIFITMLIAFLSALGYLFISAPLSLLSLLYPFTIPLFAASRVPQILSNLRNGHTGQLSFITVAVNFLGVCARVFTTLQEISDPLVFYGVSSSFVLNGLILLQMILYWNKTNKIQEKSTHKKKQ
jgi:mannose-P-dolichol utilization defect protein 1